jgi:hypothetical protein
MHSIRRFNNSFFFLFSIALTACGSTINKYEQDSKFLEQNLSKLSDCRDYSKIGEEAKCAKDYVQNLRGMRDINPFKNAVIKHAIALHELLDDYDKGKISKAKLDISEEKIMAQLMMDMDQRTNRNIEVNPIKITPKSTPPQPTFCSPTGLPGQLFCTR